MLYSWKPSFLGKLFTSTKSWELSIDGNQFRLDIGGQVRTGNVLQLEKLTVKPGKLWATVTLGDANGQVLVLDGISNSAAKRMREIITLSIKINKKLSAAIAAVIEWVNRVKKACDEQLNTRGWLSHEFKQHVTALKPRGLENLLKVPMVKRQLAQQPEDIQKALAFWKRSFDEIADNINKNHMAKELVASRSFFDMVEKSPLTQEQAEAVICFDNRVLLVASAGSGKTSTMVAKAGYALKKGYFTPDRILLLAFNNDAAAELRKRIKARLEPLGLPANKIVAKTFHAFGLDVIGSATGKRPSLAPWLDMGRDLEALMEMVDEIKDADPKFRASWDMFRLIFSQDLPRFGEEEDGPEAWDPNSRRRGFWTLNNEVVKLRIR